MFFLHILTVFVVDQTFEFLVWKGYIKLYWKNSPKSSLILSYCIKQFCKYWRACNFSAIWLRMLILLIWCEHITNFRIQIDFLKISSVFPKNFKRFFLDTLYKVVLTNTHRGNICDFRTEKLKVSQKIPSKSFPKVFRF